MATPATAPEVKKTITQVDKSTKAMNSAVTALTKTMNELSSLTEISDSLAFDIEQKSSELTSIKENINNELRSAKAELNIKILENEDKVLDQLLKDRRLAKIEETEVQTLKSDLQEAQASNEAAIEDAVNQAIRNEKIASNAQQARLESQHSVETAELKAENVALKSRIEFLTESNEQLKQMIDNERVARVDMAKNASQPVVNVSSGK